jgi:hypothetical protein
MCKICNLRKTYVCTNSERARIILNCAERVLQEKKFHLSFCYVLASTHISDLILALDNAISQGFMLSHHDACVVLFP